MDIEGKAPVDLTLITNPLTNEPNDFINWSEILTKMIDNLDHGFDLICVFYSYM